MQDARILVAGASGDIGRAIAFVMIEAGAEVIMLGRNVDRLMQGNSLSARIGRRSHQIRYVAVDLTDLAAVSLAGAGIAASGRLDALVLSAGTYQRSQEPEAFRRQIDTNLVGPYALLQAVLPLLVDSKGQVIFINSSQALRAAAEVGQYAATKHATKAIADSLRDEVNDRGVRVTSLYLGRTAGKRQREIYAMEGKQYQPNLLIQADDVARMVLQVMAMPRNVEVTDVMMRPMRRA